MMPPERLVELQANAAADNHKVVAPTHVAMKNGEVVGYLSHGAIPTVLVWFDTKKVSAGDSTQLIVKMEEIAMSKGYPAIAVPCSESSPYFPYMPKFGYHDLAQMHMFVRQLTPK
jgi:hypothetical protein